MTARDDHEEGTRERILDVAAAMFYARGYRGTSLNAIAREVGISAPALYWHFSSKDEICFSAIHRELERFVAALAAGAGGGRADERLAGYVRAYVRLKLEQSDWLNDPGAASTYRQLRDALRKEQRAELDVLQRRALDLLEEVLAAGSDAGLFSYRELVPTAWAIVTMCEYVFAWYRPSGSLSPDEIADRYAELALSMVGGTPPRQPRDDVVAGPSRAGG